MSELFRIYVLSSNIRTCFFYLNDSDLRYFQQTKRAIKLQFGPDRQKIAYGSISLIPLTEVPSKCIGVESLYASQLGLKENEVILVSYCDVDSINSLQILPKKEEDFVVLLSCKSILEAHLLDQVSVVAEGQVLPLYVFSNILINVEIGKLDLQSGYGQLEKFTEVVVIYPSKSSTNLTKIENQIDLGKDTKEKNNVCENIYNQLRKILKTNINESQVSEQKKGETILKHLVEDTAPKKIEYKIQPHFLFSSDLPKHIQNKFIVVSNLENIENSFGPYSVKILAKIEKVLNNAKEKYETVGENKNQNLFLYSYVISLNNDDNHIAFCPPYVLKKLKLFIGSKIVIERIKSNSQIEVAKWPGKIDCDEEYFKYFWKSAGDIRENIKKTVIYNFTYNFKINTLILGGPGTGKTFFLTDIANEFTDKFVFCKLIHCKSLRGKKIETLHKLWIDSLRECSLQEPSLFIVDDLHALTYIDEDEGQFNRLYSNRIVDLMSDILQDFQEKYNISVIASGVNMSQLSALKSPYGPRLFQNVITIPEMNFSERSFALKNIINSKIGVSKDFSIDLDKLSSSTNGYTIQDLNDLVVKAIFNCFLRNDTEENISNITQIDFDSALSESSSLNLRSVKFKQNIDTKWDNVGGMVEPKKILIEVFSWPLKYPQLLESCPLRLQRGVLLYGAPGTGKTLLAGALASKCGLNFISVKGPEVLSKYVGASEEGVRNLFLQAEKIQPCLLFFDEFDSLAPKRGHDNSGVTDRVVNQLLTQLDGVESLNGVWILAATSRPDLLDPALLRPGRLDKMVFCNLPDQLDRLSILEVLSQNLSKAEDVNLLEIAQRTEEYTGADLQAILYSALISSIKEGKNSLGKKSDIKIKQTHLVKALSEVKPSLSQRERKRFEKIYEKFRNSRKRNFVDNYEGVQRVTLA